MTWQLGSRVTAIHATQLSPGRGGHSPLWRAPRYKLTRIARPVDGGLAVPLVGKPNFIRETSTKFWTQHSPLQSRRHAHGAYLCDDQVTEPGTEQSKPVPDMMEKHTCCAR